MNAVATLQSMGLQSPTPFLRTMMSQSNCFQVIDTAVAGMSRRAVKPRWVITPNIVMSNPDAGGFDTGMIGGLTGNRWLRSVGGSVRTKQAQTALFVADAKSGMQIAAVQGNAQSVDFGAAFAGWGRGVGTSFGAYTDTPEGKVIMAAYLDAFNNMVEQLRTRKGA